MNKQRQERIAELRWASERESKKSDFLTSITPILNPEKIEILDFELSDEIQNKHDDWPGSTPDFTFQTPKKNTISVTEIIRNLVERIEGEYAFISMMNLNFGLVKLPKSELVEHWIDIIELDGDEFFIYNPNDSYFVCIELTEDFLPNGSLPEWIYELTFSTRELKKSLVVNSGT